MRTASFVGLDRIDLDLVGAPHDHQIQCHIEPGSNAMFRRSLFGLVCVYNNLPAYVVQADSVKKFNGSLQDLMKKSASNDGPLWSLMFHSHN